MAFWRKSHRNPALEASYVCSLSDPVNEAANQTLKESRTEQICSAHPTLGRKQLQKQQPCERAPASPFSLSQESIGLLRTGREEGGRIHPISFS